MRTANNAMNEDVHKRNFTLLSTPVLASRQVLCPLYRLETLTLHYRNVTAH